MTTPQSTKKIEEILKDYNGYDFCGELSCSGQNKANELTQQLLTILKETCEAALPEKKNGCSTHHSTVRPNTFCSSGECLANSNFNQAIDQTRANFNNLLGGDDE